MTEKSMGNGKDQPPAVAGKSDEAGFFELVSSLTDCQQDDGPIHVLKSAVRANPSDSNLVLQLANLLRKTNQLPASLICYHRVLQLNPEAHAARLGLGNMLKNMKRFAEAAECFTQILNSKPDWAEVHYNLGNTLRELDQTEASVASYQRALEIKPDFVPAYTNLGFAYESIRQFDDALNCFREAAERDCGNSEMHNNLGALLCRRGQFAAAADSLFLALEIDPLNAEAHKNLGILIGDLNFTDHSREFCTEANAIYGEVATAKALGRFSSWLCQPNPTRLRVGLVSGDLRQHSVSHFLDSILSSIDKNRIELIAYPTVAKADQQTVRIKALCSAWKPLVGLSDEAAAKLIHDDGVHVLIDLSGHTAHNRLPVFAWKPAPVQVTWLGYLGTTGVTEIDYLLADANTLLESEESSFSEEIWRLPESYLCFTPPDKAPEVALLPALRNGYVTFGSFNNLAKITDQVVALWARILEAVPLSRLLIKTKQLADPSVRQNVLDRFAACGIDEARLILKAWVDRDAHLALYGEVDFALDPFPYPGITTSVEGLWMGVPVLTLAGKRFVERQGVGIMTNVGLPEWIAVNQDDYLERAVKHATDLPRLANLRKRLRGRVAESPLFDTKRFARHFEVMLVEMWEHRCLRVTARAVPTDNEQAIVDAKLFSGNQVPAPSVAIDSQTKASMGQAIAALLDTGVALHRQGKFVQAEQLYKEILNTHPQHFDALQLTATIALQRKDLDNALTLFDRALEINPTSPHVLNNRGNVLSNLGRHGEALASYERVLAIKPDHVEALYNRGNALRGLMRNTDALESLKEALRIQPGHLNALLCSASVLKALSRMEEAVSMLDKAIAVDPYRVAVWNSRGSALQQLGRPDDALTSYDYALKIDAENNSALMGRCYALVELNRPADALQSYEKILAIEPDNISALINRGYLLHGMEHMVEALASFDRVLALKHDDVSALNNRGITLVALDRAEEALTAHEFALAIAPNDASTHFNRAVALNALGRRTEALVAYAEALRISPDDVTIRVNETLCRFGHGDLKTAWQQYGWRWKSDAYRNAVRPFPIHPLTPTTRTALLWGEQGAGDQILYASMLPDLVERGITGVIEVEPRLVPLFTRSFPSFECVARATPPHTGTEKVFDTSLPMADLGQFLRNDFSNFPHRVQYLRADPKKVKALRKRYGATKDVRIVGLSWRSGAPRTGDSKSCALVDWAPIFTLPGFRFVSLQYGEQAAELAEVKRRFGVDVLNDKKVDQLASLDDFASQVAAMDHIVSISNTTAHFAGALGVPATILLPYSQGLLWYWFADRSECPWYPSVTLLRPKQRGGWSGILQQAADRLIAARLYEEGR